MGAKGSGPESPSKNRPKTAYGNAEKCYICEKTVFAMEKGEADGMVFHKNCFRCTTCNKVVGIGKYASLESKIYCKTHFKQLFKLKGNYNEGSGTEQHKNTWAGKGKLRRHFGPFWAILGHFVFVCRGIFDGCAAVLTVAVAVPCTSLSWP